ncbi:peptide deformylase [Candidatus Shikimatogenerans silvanidophilus]|uniref:peptide deformylase n=1 Tax=Candidatus Shikimatogenerans silvanidophilus TaxID=2782547 RepID=UPI001BA92962|nr:peptide deformylase [Candidatus Shikimatogenerans silvanidophilus]
MILPILIYNNYTLRKKSENVKIGYNLKKLINNMFETMYNANGIGLASSQIGININLFIIDLFKKKKIFINSKIIKEYGKKKEYKEGCLSFPGINNKNIYRKSKILLEFYDENWKKNIKNFKGILARVIQHEYDHINGILFIDFLSKKEKKEIKNNIKKINKWEYPIIK